MQVNTEELPKEKKKADPKESREMTAGEVWHEYEKARSYNEAIDLYNTVEKNEDFYIGEQWRGVHAPNLDKPVFNILARVVKFFISSIMSDDIGVSLEAFDETEEDKPMLDMVAEQMDAVMENTAYKKKCREVIRNAAVDGDGCLHFYFDPEDDGGLRTVSLPGAQDFMPTPGQIQTEMIENTNLHFGNPQNRELQQQPYLLLNYRRLVTQVKREAEQNGCDPDEVQPDEDENRRSNEQEDGKVTVVRRYWKQKNGARRTVWCCEVCAGGFVRKPWDTGYTLYPVTMLPWEKVKNRYHGQAALTGLIPNQIYVNKLYALAMEHVKKMAFPKVVYNSNLLPQGWDNRVGAAIGVPGDPNAAVAAGYRAPDMSAQVMQLIDRVIEMTRDTMGASDAALGNVRPDNTSAIIVTQKATAMPLELQKQDFYSFVEESVRIWLDMMTVNYGVRPVRMKTARPDTPDLAQVQANGLPAQQGAMTAEPEEEMQTVLFDFAQLAQKKLKLNVEIGAATYWSELMQVQTMDNLFGRGLMDAETYLENMPRGYIPNRTQLIQALQKQAQQAAQAQQETMAGQGAQGVQGGQGAQQQLPPGLMEAMMKGGGAT